MFTPDQIPWQDGPPSLLPGAKMAILEGDPTKEVLFTMRLKLPDGYRVLRRIAQILIARPSESRQASATASDIVG